MEVVAFEGVAMLVCASTSDKQNKQKQEAENIVAP